MLVFTDQDTQAQEGEVSCPRIQLRNRMQLLYSLDALPLSSPCVGATLFPFYTL